jgi:hypothetical protein
MPKMRLLFTSVRSDYVCKLLPPTGLLFIPQVIYEYGAKVECHWQEKTKELDTWADPGVKLDLCGGKPATNHLSHGTA